MKRRPHFALLWMGFALLAVIAASLWFFPWSGTGDAPEEIYNQRFTRGYAHAITQMRALHRRNPTDPATRYWLASLLIEDAKEQGAIAEAVGLLRQSGDPSQLGWINIWSEARTMQAYSRGLDLLGSEGSTLKRELNLPEGDAQLKQFVTDSLSSMKELDVKLRPAEKPREATLAKKTKLTGDEVREDLFTLKNLLAERWAYVAEKEKQTGKSLDALLAEGLAQVQPTMTLANATKVMTRFVASLEDGHTHLGYDSPRYSLPFRVTEAAEGLIISQIAKPGLGIEAGDRLISVDDEAALEALEAQKQLAISSTEASRRAAAVRSLPSRWCEERNYRISVERAGKIISTEIQTQLTGAMAWPDQATQANSTSWIASRSLAPGIAYMKVSTWWPATHSGPMNEDRLAIHRTEIDQAVAEVKGAAHLVLDLRNNPGGSDALCTYLASYFVPDPMKTYVLRYRTAPEKPIPEGHDGFENAERTEAKYPRQSGPVLNTRIWVLMDEGCFSATDTLLNVLTRNIPDRVVTIGRPNGAGIGGPNLVGTLRNSGLPVTCSTCKAYSTDGDLLEGHPVQVNHPVQWTRADIVSGKDADLEAALKLIQADQK